MVGYRFLFPILGSQIKFVFGYRLVSKTEIIFLKTLRESSKPFFVTTLKLSLSVWYSGYSLDLENETKGKSTLGEQYCLSSLPLFKNEYFFTFFKFFKAAIIALSAKLFPFLLST